MVTKIDMCPPNVLQETLKLLIRILKSPGCRKFPVLVKSQDDVILSATKFVSERLCPIFQVSNVSGENLDLLKMFLNLLSSRQPNTDEEPSEFQIDDTYSVPGVGTVVSGTNLKGTIRVSAYLLFHSLFLSKSFILAKRQLATWSRPPGPIHPHRHQEYSPKKDACLGGQKWANGIVCFEAD